MKYNTKISVVRTSETVSFKQSPLVFSSFEKRMVGLMHFDEKSILAKPV